MKLDCGGNTLEKFLSKKALKVISFLMLAILSLSYITYEIINYFLKEKTLQETGIKFTYDFNSGTNFYTHLDNFFFFTKDGMKYVDNKGKTIITDIYNMNNPVFMSEGEFIVVSEKGGKNIYVYNTQGRVYTMVLDNPLINISMNDKGYISVVTEKEDEYELLVYDDKGLRRNYWSHSTTNVLPLTTDISNDGRILAASFMHIDGLNIGTKIVYAYIDKEESNKKLDGQVTGAIINENRFILKMNFMENNNLIVVSENEISCLIPVENLNLSFKEKWKIPLKNKLSKVITYKDKNIIVAYSNGILNEKAEEVGLVKVIDLNAHVVAKYKGSGEITYLNADFNSFIVGVNKKFEAISFKGDKLWEYSSIQDVKDVIFYKNKNSALFVNDVNAFVRKLTRTK